MKSSVKFLNSLLNIPFIILIKIYQKVISPLTSSSCRYYPSCSSYSLQCFQKFNLFKATYKSAYRVLRCNPYSDGGVDFP